MFLVIGLVTSHFKDKVSSFKDPLTNEVFGSKPKIDGEIVLSEKDRLLLKSKFKFDITKGSVYTILTLSKNAIYYFTRLLIYNLSQMHKNQD